MWVELGGSADLPNDRQINPVIFSSLILYIDSMFTSFILASSLPISQSCCFYGNRRLHGGCEKEGTTVFLCFWANNYVSYNSKLSRMQASIIRGTLTQKHVLTMPMLLPMPDHGYYAGRGISATDKLTSVCPDSMQPLISFTDTTLFTISTNHAAYTASFRVCLVWSCPDK